MRVLLQNHEKFKSAFPNQNVEEVLKAPVMLKIDEQHTSEQQTQTNPEPVKQEGRKDPVSVSLPSVSLAPNSQPSFSKNANKTKKSK